jgi:hypothetical protein
VLTRCDDQGDVDLEVWAGDPGPPPAGWEVVFEGELETEARGFDAGTATASSFGWRRLRAPVGCAPTATATRTASLTRCDSSSPTTTSSPDTSCRELADDAAPRIASSGWRIRLRFLL